MPSPSSPDLSYEMTFPVEESDIDFMGHVNNIVYLRWAQEIATAHWQQLAPAEVQEALLWVVSRHEIDYKSAALHGDAVKVKTSIGAASGLTFERLTEMRRASDGELLAQARTLWIPINSQTRRPQRLSPQVRALFSTNETV